MATNQLAEWNWNNEWDDSQRQRDETMLQHMAKLKTLHVGIGAELKELNRRVHKN